MKTITFHLAHMFKFSGRESREVFWPYAAFVILLSFAGMAVLMVPAFVSAFARMQQFAAEHPDQATITSGPGSYSIQVEGNHPELFPDFAPVMAGIAAVTAIVVFLLAAAVVRRLHDRGWSGLWGVMPLPFLSAGMVLMPRLFGAQDPDLSLFGYLFLNNFVYLGTLAGLVFLLTGASNPGDNRFGPPPVA